MLAAGIPSFELKKIKRNAGKIVRACHAIKDGQLIAASPKLDLEEGANWRHFEIADDIAIQDAIETLVTGPVAREVDSITDDVQIISPVNKRGLLSCEAMNARFRPIFNLSGANQDEPLVIGDKVVRTKNGKAKLVKREEDDDGEDPIDFDTETRIVNGDIGMIMDVQKKKLIVRFGYPTRTVELAIQPSQNYLKHAYALTGHKMQGSEAPVIILPLSRQFMRIPIINREWIYTAFSRAKKILITVGNMEVLRQGISRVSVHQRQTSLADLILENRKRKEDGQDG